MTVLHSLWKSLEMSHFAINFRQRLFSYTMSLQVLERDWAKKNFPNQKKKKKNRESLSTFLSLINLKIFFLK